MQSETDKELLHQEGGSMDIKEHLRTWHGFMSFLKWLIIGNIALLVFLFAFRTHD